LNVPEYKQGMLVQCRVLAAAVLKEKMKIERDIAWKRKGQMQNRFGNFPR